MNLDDHYKYYSENLKLISKALTQNALQIRKAISLEDIELERILLRQYIITAAAWLETKQRKLLFQGRLFSTEEIKNIYKKNNKIEEWLSIINIAFSKHYGEEIPRTKKHKRDDLLDLVNKNFVPFINLRNRLAHGQWVYTFNSDELGLEPKYMAQLNTMSNIKIQHFMNLAKRTSELIRDLVISEPTFERDFDSHWKGLEESKKSFELININEYKAEMVAKYKRGIEKRNNNLKQRTPLT